MNIERIAKLARERRRILGVDQVVLAKLSGVSVHTLSDIESARGNTSIKVLCKVLEALGMEMQINIKRHGENP